MFTKLGLSEVSPSLCSVCGKLAFDKPTISGLNCLRLKKVFKNFSRFVGLAFLAGILSGCVLENVTKSDPGSMVGKDMPAHWTGGRFRVSNSGATGWLDDFRSSRLKALVREAVEKNYSLAAARSRVDQALERANITNAERRPRVDAGVSGARFQNLRGAAFQTVTASSYNLSLDFSWELDIWGRIRDLRDGQLDLMTAESNLYQWSRFSIAANTVKTALEIVESRQQIALSRKNLKSLETNLDILDSKLEAGDADDRTALEISLSRADIARAKSNILVEERQIDGSRRSLETLLGRYPKGEIDALSSLPQIGRKVPIGLLCQLLLRRPDLLAEEARVDAKLKDVAAARKALLPAVRITGGTGTSTTSEFEELFNLQNLVWNLGANLSRPLYAGGRLKSEIRLTEHERDELMAGYAETALTAFREVETALAAEAYLIKQVLALETAVTEARRAEELSLSQYEKGLVEIITLLESQRRYFDAQSSLLNVQLQLLLNRVDLYLALGGDFDHEVVVAK